MKVLLISAGMLFAAAASAQTAPGNWADTILPPGATPPLGDGTHNCLSQYPEKAKAEHIEGTTSLSYRITADGAVTAVKVAKSSGDATLDKAAVKCVKAWQYRAAKIDDKPVETTWRNDVKWVLKVHNAAIPTFPPPAPVSPPPASPPSASAPPSPPPVNTITVPKPGSTPPPISAPASTGRPHICTADYPRGAYLERTQGTVVLRFTITTEGATSNITIAESSGDASLDDAAVGCASTWRYKPAVKDSAPVAVPWKAEVRWALH